VAASLLVVTGLNDPQTPPAHVTVHCTCGFAETSLLIVAFTDTVAPACREAGGTPPNVTVMGTGGVMVIVAEIDFVLSPTRVAVTVTVPPEGIAEGAV
jgi:hypothetical protein